MFFELFLFESRLQASRWRGIKITYIKGTKTNVFRILFIFLLQSEYLCTSQRLPF